MVHAFPENEPFDLAMINFFMGNNSFNLEMIHSIWSICFQSMRETNLGSKILNLEPCIAYVGLGSQIPDIVMKIPSPIFGIGDPRIPNPGFQFEMQLCTTERCGSLGFLGGGGMSQCCENTPSLARRLRCMRSGAPLGSAPGWARYHFHGIRTEDRSSSSSGMLGCTSSGGVHNASTRVFFQPTRGH